MGGPLPEVPPESFDALIMEKGLDDAAMHRWHVVFARQNPEGHRAFLLSLGLADEVVTRIQSDVPARSQG